MTRRQRVLAWGGVVAGVSVASGLIVLVVVADLNTAGQVAGILGSLIGLAGLGVSLYALKPPARPEAGVGASGARAVAAGGDISGAVSTGDDHSSGRP